MMNFLYINRRLQDGGSYFFYSRLQEGIMQEASRLGVNIIFYNNKKSLGNFYQKGNYRAYTGIIGVMSDRPGEECIWKSLKKELPCIRVTTRLPQSGSHYVGIDERKTIQLLMDHLTEQNCRNIGFFTFISEGFVLERVRELVADLRARDLQVNQQWIYGYSCAKDRLDSGICAQSAKRVNRKTGLSLHSHIQAYIRRMRYFGFPDAVIFSTDRQAVLFMQAAAAAGIRIPEDVAVAGIDDSQIAYDVSEQELCARLTTIRQNFREIGRSAVRLLNVVCRNPDSSREMLIDPLLIVRASTLKQSSGCFVPADINFRSEITAWLEDHYADEHILQQLTERFELNKAYFLIKCKKLFGVNFIRLLNDVRIRKSLYYLGHTDQNITEIYTAAGYNSYQNFNREFKKRLGKPPYRYKKLSGVRRIAY